MGFLGGGGNKQSRHSSTPPAKSPVKPWKTHIWCKYINTFQAEGARGLDQQPAGVCRNETGELRFVHTAAQKSAASPKKPHLVLKASTCTHRCDWSASGSTGASRWEVSAHNNNSNDVKKTAGAPSLSARPPRLLAPTSILQQCHRPAVPLRLAQRAAPRRR